MRNFAEKLKSDKKARAVVICASFAAVALIAAAIAIPVVIHNNRIPKEAQAAQTTPPSELTTQEVSTTQAVTVPETAESTEPPTTAPTTAASVSNSGQNSKPTSDKTKKKLFRQFRGEQLNAEAEHRLVQSKAGDRDTSTRSSMDTGGS